jgi:hypothetical protein
MAASLPAWQALPISEGGRNVRMAAIVARGRKTTKNASDSMVGLIVQASAAVSPEDA